MQIVAMIPARGGSKGIKNKNMRIVGDKPLIVHTMDAAKASQRLSRIIFSSDCSRMQTLAKAQGIEAPFLRPAELAQDTTCMIDVMDHCVNWLKTNDGYSTDLLVTLYPTTPFRTGDQIDDAIHCFLESKMDCLVSVGRQKHHPYWSLGIEPEGRLHHYFGKENLYYRRQDMPATFEQNGAIYIVPAEKIRQLDMRSMTDNTLAYVMDSRSSINIDDELDLVLADALARGDGSANGFREKIIP